MHSVMAMPFQFIDSNILKKCTIGFTNHTWPILHYIALLVINALGGRHTDTQEHILTHKHIYRHTNKNNFKKPGACGRTRTPGLKTNFESLLFLYKSHDKLALVAKVFSFLHLGIINTVIHLHFAMLASYSTVLTVIQWEDWMCGLFANIFLSKSQHSIGLV